MHCAHQCRVVRKSCELVHESFQTHLLDAFENLPHFRLDIRFAVQKWDSGHRRSFARSLHLLLRERVLDIKALQSRIRYMVAHQCSA